MHIYIYIHIHVYVFIYLIHIFIYVYVCVHIYIYTHTCTYIFIYMFFLTHGMTFGAPEFLHLIYKIQGRKFAYNNFVSLTHKHGMESRLTGFYKTHFADKLAVLRG